VSELREQIDTEFGSEERELIDEELDTMCGGISDLGTHITKAVDDALSAAIGGYSNATAPILVPLVPLA
jgi:hypothetical protein